MLAEAEGFIDARLVKHFDEYLEGEWKPTLLQLQIEPGCVRSW